MATALIAVFGWRNAYLIIGTVTLLAFVTLAQVMRRDPQGIGLLPDGCGDQTCIAAVGSGQRSFPLREAVRSGRFWTLCIAEFIIFFCLVTIVIHIVPYARDLGLSPVAAAGVLSTIGGVSMLGRISMGTMNDRIGGKRSLIICFIVLLCGLIWLQAATAAWMLFLFAAIYGFAHGGFFTVMSPTVAELFGTGSHGLLFGIVLFSGTIGGAFGPLIAGRTFDVTGSYRMVYLALIVMAAVGFALVTLLQPPREADTGT
jgi:MFS family permease